MTQTNARKNNALESERLLFTFEYRAVWLVAIIGLSLSLAALWLIRQQLDAHKLLDFEWVSHNRMRAINHGIDNNLLAIINLRDFYLASGDIGLQQFQSFAESQLKRYQGIRSLVWISRVDGGVEDGSRSTAERHVEGGESQQDSRGSVSSSLRNMLGEHYSADLATTGEAATDVFEDPELVKLLARSRDSGRMAASGPISLGVGGDETSYGFMVSLPIFQRQAGTSPTGSDQTRLLGFVVGLFELDRLINTSISLLEPRGVEILFLDGSMPAGHQFLHFYASRVAPAIVNRENYLDWLKRGENPRVSETVRVADKDWTVICGQTNQFRSAEAFKKSPWAVMATVLLFTMLISFYLVRVRKNSEERVAIQEQLVEREELFRQMTETVDEVFWALQQDATRLLYLSPNIETILGVPPGRDNQSVKAILEFLSSEDRVKLTKALEQIRRSSTPQELIHQVHRADGTTRWVRTRGFPVSNQDGELYRIVGFIEDITEQKLADEALKESESKLRDMFQQSPDIIMTVDEQGQILMMNRSIPELPAERAVGHSSMALMPRDFRRWFRRELKKVFRENASPTFEYSTDDGTFWEGRIVPIRADDRVTAAMVTASDVTEKQNLEIQAQRNARLASIGVLSTGVAHEINNPNNAIKFNAGLVQRAWSDIEPILADYYRDQGDFALGGLAYSEARETFPRLLSEITLNSERIRRIVENLKHMARQDTGKLTEVVDIQQVLEATRMILHNQIQKYTDVCTLDVPDGLPPVKGNSQQLEQVFINVLLNSLQSLPDRSRGVFISARLEEDTENVAISVRDEGCGIAERDIGRLTEPFFTTRTESGGTGLGLSISRSIVEKHGGNLKFESEPGKGTRVSIRIPAIHTK